nr:ABC transporter ATP-binding protein [uncultured Tolumonas sp.]
MLQLKSVSKSYGQVSAVHKVDLAIPQGSRTAIVGSSGSGKTTLLRMIAGFEFPDGGEILLGGQLLVNGQLAVPAHQRGIGYVPQDGALFPHMKVEDNIAFSLTGTKIECRRRVSELLEQVELNPTMASRWPHELSGGQQQRVSLARALAQQPRLMLLDEPFSALDAGLRVALRKTVARILAAAGITTILVTHDQAEALSFADQLAVMRGGRLVQAGPPTELYYHPDDENTAHFLGEAIILPASLSDNHAECVLGRLALSRPTQRREACILLRPEQLKLCEPSESACIAEVLDSEFTGSVTMLTVRLSGHDELMSVRHAGLDAPPLGSQIGLSVSGMVHVFAARRI